MNVSRWRFPDERHQQEAFSRASAFICVYLRTI
jgi:hypothetical protein